MQEEQCKFLTHRLNAKAKESFGKRPFCRKDSRFAAAPMCRFAKCCGCLLRKSVILLWLRIPRHGIITSKLPLTRLSVCAAHAPVLAHRALRTLNHAKPQQVRFCWGRFAASWYNRVANYQRKGDVRCLPLSHLITN